MGLKGALGVLEIIVAHPDENACGAHRSTYMYMCINVQVSRSGGFKILYGHPTLS